MLAEMAVGPTIPPEYKEFEDVFNEPVGSAALPQHQPWDNRIPIEEGKTLTHYAKPRPYTREEETFLQEYVQKELEKNFIHKSTSPIAHGVVFATKKDGKPRPCINFRPTNAITVKWRHPLPRIDESQDRLLGMKVFTIVDIRDAFNRIRIAEGKEWKTAFNTR